MAAGSPVCYKEVVMGFLSGLFGSLRGGSAGSVSSALYRVEYTDAQLEMLQNGYKENSEHEIFEPDTVWAGPRSKVYHSQEHCGGTGLETEGAVPMHESEALRRGLHRCKKCEWPASPMPEPSRRPLPEARPVSRCKVSLVRGGR